MQAEWEYAARGSLVRKRYAWATRCSSPAKDILQPPCRRTGEGLSDCYPHFLQFLHAGLEDGNMAAGVGVNTVRGD